MNTENTEDPTVAEAVSEYQRLMKDANRKLKKYLRAQAVMETRRKEWEAAQEATYKGVAELKETLR